MNILTKYKYFLIETNAHPEDPYGEEIWDEKEQPNDIFGERPEYNFDDVWDNRDIWADERRQYQEEGERGRAMVNRWNDERNQIRRKIIEMDTKIGEFVDDDEDLENFDKEYVGHLTMWDYYNDETHRFKCPKCGRVSRHNRQHGDAYKCGRCGLKTRNYANAL